MEKACDEAHITLNKNAVVGDSSAMNPGGVRIGKCLQGVTHILHDATRQHVWV
jgi:glycine/serine hydroxymethyltransferase